MTDRDGRDIACTAEQTGGVLTVTVDEDFAILTGRLSGIRTLKAQGVEKLVFVTKGATSAFMLSDLLEKGESGEAYWLTHDGKAVTFTLGEGMADVSAILTKPQAKSQKPCRRAGTSCVCPPCLPKTGRAALRRASIHLDCVQIRLYIFGFLGPLGLDSGRFTTPFLKCVFSNFSKKTNNPNPSPMKEIWFGLYWFGAGNRT